MASESASSLSFIQRPFAGKKKGPISGATFSKEAIQVGVRKGDAKDRSGYPVGSKKVENVE